MRQLRTTLEKNVPCADLLRFQCYTNNKVLLFCCQCYPVRLFSSASYGYLISQYCKLLSFHSGTARALAYATQFIMPSAMSNVRISYHWAVIRRVSRSEHWPCEPLLSTVQSGSGRVLCAVRSQLSLSLSLATKKTSVQAVHTNEHKVITLIIAVFSTVSHLQ